ncbi:ergothioneine biosynthesis protein EgtB [Leucothrix arctica]|uniref:Ergothioneine biosynthesis protein EgtB n=1 Tax=Leucothrix arctica TaxID=1481894 RepID=A0A317CB03_9GAMM|nr:ergothioneine biosynthesis protein EgtB [Leucothrix arctica]PWQ94503.1 ergothioneine biosynthesis protein EgtB [Leucothrix arctica]
MKKNLTQAYRDVRQYTEQLCKPLNVEDYVPQAVDYASPPKWHLAHVTWFFETMILQKHLEGYEVFNESFNFLFNSYYQTIGKRAMRAERGVMTRPTVGEVYQYRQHVDVYMAELLAGEVSQELEDLVVLGLNHEQQHQELLITDLKYVLALNPMAPVYRKDSNLVADHNADSEFEWLSFGQGVHSVGYQGNGFCFDNEQSVHNTYIQSFEISTSLVTNGEYLAFMKAGGYENFNHWLDEGWAWVNKFEVKSPLYWQEVDGEWFYYTLAGLQPVDPDAILSHVSFYEANAFAQWKGCRLPTEFEWEVAAPGLDWGKRWEWTSSAYLPYPNFAISEGAVGEYNGKFMVNQMVLRGASVATSEGHSRLSYRNFFHPYFQWQFSGIRLAK